MKLGGFPERIWRGKLVRILFLAAVLLLLATITRPGPRPPPPGPGAGMLAVVPVALDAADPGNRRAGALRFLAGWSLASADPRFGGISGMHVEAGEVIAVSDIGMVIRFPVPGARTRIPVRFAPLTEGPGPRTRKSSRDSESLLIEGEAMWVAFERHNMVWRYDRASLRSLSSAQPGAMRRWRANAGPEALARLADGRFLALAEGRDDGGALSDALLFAGDPADPATAASPLHYRRPPGYRATDAALLPDGRILILNRRFTLFGGFSARLAVARIGPGAMIEGREIARFEAPLIADNMEALSITREGAHTIVWIASDDNFSPLQRTLLLKFELTAEPSPRRRPGSRGETP